MSKPYKVQDRFFKKAKEQGFRARSVYKLEAIQNKFHLLRPGDLVLDLGAAPGSFLQFISKVIGPEGAAIGVDLKPIDSMKNPNIRTLVMDILSPALSKKIVQDFGIKKFDVITSDLAPSTTGIRSVDSGRSFDLSMGVLQVAERLLKNGGHLVIKYFPGAEQTELLLKAKELFSRVTLFKPEAVRSSSREIYLIGLSKKA